ncbi:LpqB family beta-propeller domain-containing protein [Nocardioides sp. YIM 152588]|uniref:LpqB family beta-propeller domain-containing protein n=1 Tax=Nocardioides sp. YIM 152588 TaxID=3158259 RepID=UPI0032E4321C
MTAGRLPVGRSRRSLALAAGVLAAALVVSGCVGLPDRGAVVTRDGSASEGTRRASDIDARPPTSGESRQQIVNGFLDAMTAWPIQTAVAKEYLSEEAAGEWNPEASTIVYADFLPPQESGTTVKVQLTDADLLDASGAWRGELPADERELRFPMTIEDGEFRIAGPPDALIVPASWFQQRFRQVALYYFDPAARILVPEPVFLPIGDQLATTLVSALLSGPPMNLRGVVRTFLPAEVTVGLSVPVSDTGVADVNLVGQGSPPAPEQVELMVAQLAWTLRQDPGITAFRVRIAGQEVRLANGESLYKVTSGSEYDPNGSGTSGLLYGLRAGRVVRGNPGDLSAVDGPLGASGAGLRSAAVEPLAEEAAGVTADGRSAVVAPIRLVPEGAEATTVLAGATDLLRPTWDYAGRLWLLDRADGGAVVRCVEDGRVREVDVPGITGERVRRLLVSRDGTRLLAVVRRAGGDEVVGARVVVGRRETVTRVIAPFTVQPAVERQRVVDIAWSTPTRLGVLTPARPRSLFEVDLVPVDGAAIGVDAATTIVSGRVLGLAGPGTDASPLFAVLPDGLVNVRTRESVQLGMRVAQLAYVG